MPGSAPDHAAEAMEMGADAVLVNMRIRNSVPTRFAWQKLLEAIEEDAERREIGLAEKLIAAAATSP